MASPSAVASSQFDQNSELRDTSLDAFYEPVDLEKGVAGDSSSTGADFAAESMPGAPGSGATVEGQKYRGCPCKHPIAAGFHLGFKVASVVAYLLLWIFTGSFVINFVVCVLFLAFDFWTVKNITGRLLVGLRWWNEVLEDGTSVWRFESKEDRESKVAPIDSMVFWAGLAGFPIVWLLLSLTAFLFRNFEWLLIVLVALILSLSNLWGYLRCLRDAKGRAMRFITGQYINYMFNRGSTGDAQSAIANRIGSALVSQMFSAGNSGTGTAAGGR